MFTFNALMQKIDLDENTVVNAVTKLTISNYLHQQTEGNLFTNINYLEFHNVNVCTYILTRVKSKRDDTWL